MRRFSLFAILLTGTFYIHAQGVGVGTANPDPSAIIDISGTSGGVLVPRLTKAQRNNIDAPANGLMIYQTDDNEGFYYNQGGPGNIMWRRVGDDHDLIGGQQWYTTSGTSTFIVPSDVYRIHYEIAGGGGGAGGDYITGPTYRGGGGGGGGGFLWGYLEVNPGDTLTIVVGVNGTTGTDGAIPTPGTNGGFTIISHGTLELAKVSGGNGGTAATSGANGQGGLGGQPFVWQTDRSRGIRSMSKSTSGGPGVSTTAAAYANYLTGEGGVVVSSGMFNKPTSLNKYQLVGGGAFEGYDVLVPYYGLGAGTYPNDQARWGYVSLYW